MTGGGARAAYQVGCLAHLVETLPELRVPILTGVSAGAINAVALAADEGTLAARVQRVERLWSELRIESVFDPSLGALGRRVVHWGTRLVSGGRKLLPELRGMVDTSPLAAFLAQELRAEDGRLPGIARNIASGELEALAVTGSSYSSGQSITWVQSSNETWDRIERAHRVTQRTEVELAHIMASAALPLLFPAVQVAGRWYGDGGMRLTAPLSPAIQLGAERVLAVSTSHAPPSDLPVDRCYIDEYPPPAQVAGAVLNAVFLDQLDGDALRAARINDLLENLPPRLRGGLRPVKLFVLRPSRDLGALAGDYEARLPRAFRFLTRGLGTKRTRSNDLLSLLMFQPDYVHALIELGRADAKAREDELRAFLA